MRLVDRVSTDRTIYVLRPSRSPRRSPSRCLWDKALEDWERLVCLCPGSGLHLLLRQSLHLTVGEWFTISEPSVMWMMRYIA